MPIHKEIVGTDMGEPSKIEAGKGSKVSTPTGPFKDGISELPPLKGSDSYPKRGRIDFGMQKLNKVP